MSMKRILATFVTVVVASLSLGLGTGATLAADIELTPLTADVLSFPSPLKDPNGAFHLVYELRLANTTCKEIQLENVTPVLNGNTVVPGIGGKELEKRFSIGGRRGAERATLGVGQFGVAFIHLGPYADRPPPIGIAHEIRGTIDKECANPSKETVPFAIRPAVGNSVVRPVSNFVIGRPLRGSGYLAGDGCCDSIRHVRALLPLNGQYALAQRFAIDWEQLGADNRLVRDPNKMKDVTNYNIYGQPVLAVAGGTIVARRNDLPDEIPGELPKDMTVDRADGNYVVMKLGDNGPYALYAHMQKGSVTDKTRVKPGDVLGKVGNSGNSSAPHLHFHVMDDASPLLSNGLPYLLDSFVLTGVGDSTDDFDRAERDGVPLKLTPMEPRTIKEAMPMDLMVVDFGN
jgi:hypothetical protein